MADLTYSNAGTTSSTDITPNQPPPTILRVKRRRAETSVDAVHVNVPSKRTRVDVDGNGHNYVRFRRVPLSGETLPEEAMETMQVVDVDRSLMYPEPLDDDDDDLMWDIYARDGHTEVLQVLRARGAFSTQHASQQEKIAYVSVADLPTFEFVDESSDAASDASASDQDAHSIDYPSTPPHSFDSWHSPHASDSDHEWHDHVDPDIDDVDVETADQYHSTDSDDEGWQ